MESLVFGIGVAVVGALGFFGAYMLPEYAIGSTLPAAVAIVLLFLIREINS
jgi:hypothetical protein